jgi:CubicO group peptidase (beta-lactamase class C family)
MVGVAVGAAAAVPACQPARDFSAVEAAVEAFEVEDVTVLVGDASGVLYQFERGEIESDTQLRIASASKMAFGLLVWNLVEDGTLSLDDQPQDSIPFWTATEPGGRSDVTLEQLLAFTSGFNNGPTQAGCIGRVSVALGDCVESIYDDGLDTAPGTSYNYGPEHMQIAGLMVAETTGQSVDSLFRNHIADEVGMSFFTGYGPADNARYSANLLSTADDYGRMLQGVLAGDLVDDLDQYLADRTANVVFGARPGAIDSSSLDWHYGLGFWKECDQAPYTAACDTNPTISSPGAFGFTPWIDFEHGYWAIIATEQNGADTVGASRRSVLLEQQLQPLIADALD